MEPKVKWLQASSNLLTGVTFGMPWPKGKYQKGQQYFITSESGKQWPLDAWETAFWPDESVKWTAHVVTSEVDFSKSYTISGTKKAEGTDNGERLKLIENFRNIEVENNVGLKVVFSQPGTTNVIQSISYQGKKSSSELFLKAKIAGKNFVSIVDKAVVEGQTNNRILIKISGHLMSGGLLHLPFDLRVYIYSGTKSIRIVHSFIHDLEALQSLESLGLVAKVPFYGETFYNRHIRIGGSDNGILREQVQGLSGLWTAPPAQVCHDHVNGNPVSESDLGQQILNRMKYVPTWNDYSLTQLSSDGFEIKKRTQEGCSFVKVFGGTRANGTAYVGSSANGGLAVGLSEFWERYPTQIDLNGLTKDEGEITMWLYSPKAEPLDMTPYHDGLGKDTHEKQIDGMRVTYEDWENGGFATANGIARTNQLLVEPFGETPSNNDLVSFINQVQSSPRLVPDLKYMHSTRVFHGFWSPDYNLLSYKPSEKELTIEKNLDNLFNFYKGQVEQNRWYGFWDYGDVQHTYDPYRHEWRYDVGGYAWDNSELGTDLWFWMYFLHTGRADVFKMAEAMTRHTGEVDVYHSGRFKGFGTRHGVQHFSDSSKQIRISNVLFRRIYYYLTADERVGDLMDELEDCQKSLLTLDSHRKVQSKDESTIPSGYAMTNIGLDCGPLAQAWLTSWERRGKNWENSKKLLLKLLEGIGSLKHGIGNNSILLNAETGDIKECSPPTPEYTISHLTMLFGFPEAFTEVLDFVKDEHPEPANKFIKVYMSYGRAYNGTAEVQQKEFGFVFPDHAKWHQTHSNLTAFIAVRENNEELAKEAWDQFFNTDGLSSKCTWEFENTEPPEYFSKGQEAKWITTNMSARYGVGAIHNLAVIQKYL